MCVCQGRDPVEEELDTPLFCILGLVTLTTGHQIISQQNDEPPGRHK